MTERSATESQGLIEKLNVSGLQLSKGQKRIAAYIEEHYEKAAFMTAAVISKACQVSESTVVRFACALGYQGYPEFRQALAGLVRPRLTSEQRFEIAAGIRQEELPDVVLKNDMANIRRTMETLSREAFDQAVSLLLGARRVYVLGLRAAAPLAQFLYLYLHQILEETVLVQNAVGDVFEEMARIGQEDVLMAISYPRYSSRTLECMKLARNRGAQVVALTDSPHSPLYPEAQVCLCASTDMTSFVDSLAAPLSVINALVVCLGLNRREELSEHFKQMEEIWDAHQVYAGKGDEPRP